MSDNSSADQSPLSESELRRRLLAFIDRPEYRPLKPRVIAKHLRLGEEDTIAMRRLIKRLIRSGDLIWGAKHLVQKPASTSSPTSASAVPPAGDTKPRRQRLNADERVGVYRRTSAGFGFVVPESANSGDRSGDVFIPPRANLSAMSGDLVRVRVSRQRDSERRRDSDRQRMSGRIVEVIERRNNRFVGTYGEQDGMGLVTIDGGLLDAPVWVGDAGAKNVRPSDKVLIEMVEYPVGFRQGEGVIVEVFGPRGKPGVDTLTVIHEFGLPGPFSEEVLHNAREQAAQFDPEVIPANRRDLTLDTIITIDPVTARDFDDAISLTKNEKNHWELGVHIADVSHFVPRGSALDREALDRGNSVYLPDRVIPMLPEIISNNLASLQPHRNRYAMSVFIEMDDAGTVLSTEWTRSVIRSAHRFTYEEIDDYLSDDQPWRDKLTPPVFDLVRRMHSLAMMLRKRRMDRGAIDLLLPEVAIDLDEQGQVCGAHVEAYTESHQMIEEFMLAANVAVAERLQDLGYLLLRRVHEPPSEKKLRDLTSFVRHLGISCESLESRFEIKRVVADALERPEQQAIHFAVLRSMQKAVYSPRESGHYALNADAYCHFTSPIRRYPDLVIHRMVGDLLDQRKPQASLEFLAKIGNQCSLTEQRAEQAERELIKLKLLNYLSQHQGMELEGFITGVESYGVFVQGLKLPAEGLLPLEALPADHYQYDSTSRSLLGFRAGNEFRLGDRVTVTVGRVDPDRRQLQFEYAGKAETGSAPGFSKKKASRNSAKKSSSPKRSSNDKKPKRRRR